MIHLANLFYMIAFFFIGIILTTGVYVYFTNGRERTWEYWLLYLVSLTLLMVTLGLEWYQRVFSLQESLFLLPKKIIDYTALLFCIYSFPGFIHTLFKVPVTALHLRIRRLIMVLTMILGVARILFPIRDFARICYPVLLFSTVIYCIVVGIRNRHAVKNRVAQNTLSLFLAITLIMIPYFVWDGWFNTSLYRFSFPLYLLFMGFLGIVIHLKCMNISTSESEESFAEHLRNSFDLTRREIDIIRSVLKGHSNKEVATIHFISVKTVEAHLSRVFRKVGVSNRVQLINSIRSQYS